MCALQCIGEASMGHSWTTEDKTMTPKVSTLVETFIATTCMCVPSCMVRECWPSLQENTPQQDFQGVHGTIVRRLDKVATRQPLVMAWDSFAFPQVEDEHWKKNAYTWARS